MHCSVWTPAEGAGDRRGHQATMNTDPSRAGESSAVLGTRVGSYLIGERLGAGGAAAVHLALRVEALPGETATIGEVVAVKVIHEHLVGESDFLRMFHDEATLALRLHHPNIVRTYEFGNEGDRLFMALEYLHGHSLFELIERCRIRGTVLPASLVAWVGANIARALHCAHSLTDDDGWPLGLVHRDVSPRNVFVCYDGSVKLIDFGIAHAAGRMAHTKVGHIKGTFTSIAPERVLGGVCDRRADVFSLACVLYEAATGKRLFKGADEVQTLKAILDGRVPDPREFLPGFPVAVAETLMKGLAIQVDRRHDTAAAFAGELESFVESSGLGSPQTELSATMRNLFANERATKDGVVDRMRLLGVPDAEITREFQLVPPSTSARRWRSAWGAAAAVVSLSTLGGVLFLLPKAGLSAAGASVPVIPTASASASFVALEIVVEPAVEAMFDVAGEVVLGESATIAWPMGSEPLDVGVRSVGYEAEHVTLIPDRDRTVTVALRPERRKAEQGAPADAGPPNVWRPVRPSPAPTAPPSDLLDRRH